MSLTDDKIIQNALNNPYKMVELIQDYTIFKQTQNAFVVSMQSYFQAITNANKNPQQNTTVDAIKWLHMLFDILYWFERNTNCTDLQNMDCVILRNLLEVYKRTGYYEAYRKYAQVLQVRQEVPRIQQGGMRGLTSVLYIILILTWSLGQMQGFHIDRLEALDKRITSDFAPNTDKSTWGYFSKLSSMFNHLGSCAFQAITVGLNPEIINTKIKKYMTGQYKNNIAPDLGIHVHDQKSIKLSTNYIDEIKQVGDYTFNKIVEFYRLERYYKKDAPSDDYSAKKENDRLMIINEAKKQLHLIDVVNTAANKFDFHKEPLIITFTASWSIYHDEDAHMFNVLYNSHTGKICVFDFNFYIGLYYKYINQFTLDDLNIILDTDLQNGSKSFILIKMIQLIWRFMPIKTTLYYAEPGFWDNTEFSKLPLFQYVNTYTDDPIRDNINKYRSKSIYTRLSNIVLSSKPNLDEAAKYVIDGINSRDISIYLDMGYDNSKLTRNEEFDTFYGWGCASLNNCADSAIALLETYSFILNTIMHNKQKQEEQYGLEDQSGMASINTIINKIPRDITQYSPQKLLPLPTTYIKNGGSRLRTRINKRPRRRHNTKRHRTNRHCTKRHCKRY